MLTFLLFVLITLKQGFFVINSSKWMQIIIKFYSIWEVNGLQVILESYKKIKELV